MSDSQGFQLITPPNPLTTMGQVQGVMNAQAQNKLIQAQTGLTDTQSQQAQSNLNVGAINRQAQRVMGLLALDSSQTSGAAGRQNIIDELDQEYTANPTPAAKRAHDTAIANLPGAVGADGAPTNYRPLIYQHGMMTLTGPDAFKQVTPSVQTLDTGGNIVTQALPSPAQQVLSGGTAGPTTLSGGIVKTSTPGEQGAQITYAATEADVKAGRATAVGQPIYLSAAQLHENQGLGYLNPVISDGHTAAGTTGAGGPVNSDGTKVSPHSPPRLLKVPGSPAAPAATPGAAPATVGPPPGAGTGTTAPVQPPAATTSPTSPTTPVAPPPATGTPPPAATGTPPPAATPVDTRPTASLPGRVWAAINPIGTAEAAEPGNHLGAPLDAAGSGVPVAALNRTGTPEAAEPGNHLGAARSLIDDAGADLVDVFHSVPLGQGTQEQTNIKASADKLAADDVAAANYPANKFPYEQALRLYEDGVNTGPGSAFSNRVYGFLRHVLPAGTPGLDTQPYDSLNKWLHNIVTTQGFAAGSDARLEAAISGSANVGINEKSGADMLRAGIALQRMGVAANLSWHGMSQQEQAQYGGNYLTYLRQYSMSVDPRAFAIDLYNTKQRTDLAASLAKESDAANDTFVHTVDLGRKFNLIGTPRQPNQQPMPQ